MMKDHFHLVPIEDELTHIKNYLQILIIRSGEKLICHIDADQALMRCRIPPLILHTFIENIAKHALSMYEPVTVFIKAELVAQEHGKFACITIEDSGKGFTVEALNKINSDQAPNDGESIGIWNVKQRLKLIYGNHANITVSNREKSGARIEIRLPVKAEANTA